jgi:hypothetical protein
MFLVDNMHLNSKKYHYVYNGQYVFEQNVE